MTIDLRIVAVLIARQGSSRLPGKALAPVAGEPIVAHIIERLKRMGCFTDICLATSDLFMDQPLVDLAKSRNVRAYAGSQEDVLDRLYRAAKLCSADIVVEVGGDCPLIDPGVVRRALNIYFEENPDYVTNVEPQTYPDGIDVHVVRFSSLEKAANKAILSSQRKHPLAYFHAHKDRFKGINFTNDRDLSEMRWTLDYPEDLEFIRRVFEALYPHNRLFDMKDVLGLLQTHPEIGEINRKWVTPRQCGGPAPGYWFNSSYATDLLQDVDALRQKCQQLELAKEHANACDYYRELQEIAGELRERADYYAKNH